MRLWSIHPKYLDSKGLVALWRESLLAQKVLVGGTRGYTKHAQLIRFRKSPDPVGAIAEYLKFIADEADRRQYRFNREKIIGFGFEKKIFVTSGQAAYEFKHLLRKLSTRAPQRFARLKDIETIELHPAFEKVSGEVEDWERSGFTVANPPKQNR